MESEKLDFKQLNMDRSKFVVVNTSDEEWIESPSKKVLRIKLEREKPESGCVTSVVKYQPGASFSPHSHPFGEEIFVLEGIFSDENGHYPAGTYIRNPPGTSHSPYSKNGCTIFVKLNQFKKKDTEQVVINTNEQEWLQGHGNLKVMPLHRFSTEATALVKWPAGEKFIKHSHFGGEEIFVISGVFKDEHGQYTKGTWIRSPHLSEHHPWVEEETIILVKTGHLNIF